jgi:4-amino-4-deoxy-L-arabinose transferase-like glycosyltransferase
VDEFFIQHHFARYTSNKYAHLEPFYFFWWVLPVMTLPWLPFLLIAIWKFISRKNADRQPETENDPLASFEPSRLHLLRIFAFVWMLVPVLFFTFSGSKLPGYILPALPAALVLTAEQVWRLAGNKRYRLIINILPFAVLLAVPVLLNTFAINIAKHDTAKFLIERANADGFANAKVLNLHGISHSLEFYSQRRIVRAPDGKQQKFLGVGEVADFIRQSGEKTVLVVVPVEWKHELPASDLITANKIEENNEYAVFAVSIR